MSMGSQRVERELATKNNMNIKKFRFHVNLTYNKIYSFDLFSTSL